MVLSLIRCKSMERTVERTERERERFMKHLIVTQPNPLTPWENHYLVIVSDVSLCVFLPIVDTSRMLCTCVFTANILVGSADLTEG